MVEYIKITKFEIATDGDRFHVIATMETGEQYYFDRRIKTERGAKSRLTYWCNRYPEAARG